MFLFDGQMEDVNLSDSGLIEKRIDDILKADEMIFKKGEINFKHSYRIADLVPDIVNSRSKTVKPNEKHVQSVLAVKEKYGAKIICLMHNKVRKAFIKEGVIKKSANSYGKLGEYKGSIIFSVPFPKGTNIKKEKIIDYSENKTIMYGNGTYASNC